MLELVLSYYVYLYLWLCITVFESISNKVDHIKRNNNNNFDVIFVMHLFIVSNNHENIQKDTILLFKVGQALIQTFNQTKPLFEELIQR